MFDIDNLIKNPSKSETYDDLEKTIANQMARFTKCFTNSTEHQENLKLVCGLGFDLWKTCGVRVCEDTSMTFSHIIRKFNYDMAGQFQQISNNLFNNDVCVYLYLALPTIKYNVSEESLKNLCYETIDKFVDAHIELSKSFIQPNFRNINKENIKKLYNNYLWQK